MDGLAGPACGAVGPGQPVRGPAGPRRDGPGVLPRRRRVPAGRPPVRRGPPRPPGAVEPMGLPNPGVAVRESVPLWRPFVGAAEVGSRATLQAEPVKVRGHETTGPTDLYWGACIDQV